MTLALTQVDPMESEYLHFVATVTEILEKCRARYAIGGSFASSIYGEIRSTYDVDITVQLPTEKISCIVEAFDKREWYVFPEGVEKAVRDGGEFYTLDP